MNFYSIQNLDAQSFKWFTFDPCIQLCVTYHKLVLDCFCKPFASEKPYRDLLGRLAIITSSPLGYLVVGISALIGIVFDSIIKADLGHRNRRAILEDAAYAGRKDIVTSILNLNRHNNDDLFMPLKSAGIYGHREIVEDILQRLDVNLELDSNSICGMVLAIRFISSNGHKEIANLVAARFKLWKQNNGELIE